MPSDICIFLAGTVNDSLGPEINRPYFKKAPV